MQMVLSTLSQGLQFSLLASFIHRHSTLRTGVPRKVTKLQYNSMIPISEVKGAVLPIFIIYGPLTSSMVNGERQTIQIPPFCHLLATKKRILSG